MSIESEIKRIDDGINTLLSVLVEGKETEVGYIYNPSCAGSRDWGAQPLMEIPLDAKTKKSIRESISSRLKELITERSKVLLEVPSGL